MATEHSRPLLDDVRALKSFYRGAVSVSRADVPGSGRHHTSQEVDSSLQALGRCSRYRRRRCCEEVAQSCGGRHVHRP